MRPTRKRRVHKKKNRSKRKRVLKGGQQPQPDIKIAVMAQFKNEAMVIKEWVDHYKWQGIDEIVLLDNGSTDNGADLVKGIEHVTILQAPEKHAQPQNYTNIGFPVIKQKGMNVLIVVDIDEYMFGTDGKNLKQHIVEFFGAIPRPSQFVCNWTMFGSSGLDKQPESVRKSFIMKEPKIHQNVKAVMWVDDVTDLINVHQSNVKGDTKRAPPGIQLNHYAIMSKEYFEKVKMTRGAADTIIHENIRNWDYFKRYDVGATVEDTTLRDLVMKQVGGAEHYIFCFLHGGLGNQIFIYAAALTIKNMLSMPLYLFNKNDNPHSSVIYRDFFKEGKYDDSSTMRDRANNAEKLPDKIGPNEQEFLAKIPQYRQKDIKLETTYYHDYNLIKDAIPKVKTDFINELNTKYPDFKNKILDNINSNNLVFMHVRKGDHNSLGWSAPVEYYKSALDIVDTVPEIKRIYILSNNIPYCKEQVKNNVWKSSKELIIFDEADELQCMYLMSLCTGGGIISPSTFSWWGAMFGPNYSTKSIILYPNSTKYKNENKLSFPDQVGNKWRSI